MSSVAVRCLVAVTLLLSGCGSKAGNGGTGGAGGGGGPADSGVDAVVGCGPCGANQVCLNGACVPLPSMCPCPKESYCDLATNRCVIGCTADDGCGAGRICNADQRQCVAGCRADSACGAGQICSDTFQCVAGCRTDAPCGLGKICENLQCVPGCRTDDSQCEAGRLCVNQACVPGCRADSACPGGQICESLQCVAGCRTDATCATGRICESLQCVAGCRGDTGCAAGQICVGTTCRTGCRSAMTCPAGQVCDAIALTCRNCTGSTECPAPTPICSAAGLCIADTRTCATDADCNTAVKELCFKSKCYLPASWGPCRAQGMSGGICPTGTTAVVGDVTTRQPCYCASMCTTPADCPATSSGTATTACLTATTLTYCHLSCAGGLACPYGMTCVNTTCTWM